MKILLSPAKSLNNSAEFGHINPAQPHFQSESEFIMKKLAKLSSKKLQTLMSISAAIADQNVERNSQWGFPFTNENAIPAGFAFSGAVYQGLDFSSLSKKQQEFGNETLRILSGLHGVLKPFDLIQPYRLEMGTKLEINTKAKNLYQFWGEKIKDTLEQEVLKDKEPVLINAASNEYAKAALLPKMKIRVVDVVFKDRAKDGTYKVNMTYAKIARGKFSRFVVENQLTKLKDIQAFDVDGYSFAVNESNDQAFVYLRG